MKDIIKTTHIGIISKNLDESIQFYSDFLGYKLEYFVEKDVNPIWFIAVIKNGEDRIELLQPKTDPEAAEMLNRENDCHMALQCADLHAVVNRLKMNGIEMETEETFKVKDFGIPGNDFEGIFLRGPSGERIELIQYL